MSTPVAPAQAAESNDAAQAATDTEAQAAEGTTTDPVTPETTDPAPEAAAEAATDPETPEAPETDPDAEATDETETETALKSADELLGSLKKANEQKRTLLGQVKTLEARVAELEGDLEAHATEKKQLHTNEAIKALCAEQGLKPNLFQRVLDSSAITYGDDGMPANLAELAEALLTEIPELRVNAPEGTSAANGSGSTRFDRIDPASFVQAAESADFADPDTWDRFKASLPSAR